MGWAIVFKIAHRSMSDMEIPFEKLSEEQKLSCYESYVGDCIYENGDNAPHMTYEEWCKESEQLGEALI